MHRIFKFFALLSLFCFLSGCGNPQAPEPVTSDSASTGQEAVLKQDTLFQKAKEEHGSSGSCSENSDCKEICAIIYKHQSDKDTCVRNLPVKQVELLEEVYVNLKEPDKKFLKSLRSDDLLVLLGISIEPVVTLINRRSQIQVREILTWLAENKIFSEIFKNADRRFEILKALLIKLHTDPNQALSAPLSNGSNFIEISVKENNDPAVDWIHEFFDEECGAVSRSMECLFKDHYCHLKLNPRTENYYFEYGPFLDVLKYTLEKARPSAPPAWWVEDVNIDNIDSWLDDPHNICQVAEFE